VYKIDILVEGYDLLAWKIDSFDQVEEE